MFAWDDIAVFLALYRERTTGRAAAVLGCSQPTVVRRIAALERAFGLALFKRTPAGLDPTDAAHALAAPAERVECAVCELSADVEMLADRGLDLIRLTLLHHFERLLVPVLRDFRARWPNAQTQLLASDRIYDLGRGEADIALRGGNRHASDEMIVRELPAAGWTIYASAQAGPDERPSTPADVARHPIAVVDAMAGKVPIFRWLEGLEGPAQAPLRCSSYGALKSVIASGAAVSALPCMIGDVDPELVRCFPPGDAFDVPIFLVARRVILRRPPARDLFESIAAYFSGNPVLLTGERG